MVAPGGLGARVGRHSAWGEHCMAGDNPERDPGGSVGRQTVCRGVLERDFSERAGYGRSAGRCCHRALPGVIRGWSHSKRPLIGRRDGQDGYALIAMLPNLRGTGRVLLMSATGGSALSVAGEFLEDETSVRTLRTRIGANERPFPYFEVLLQVPARSRRPGDVEMVVCRRAAARSVKGLK